MKSKYPPPETSSTTPTANPGVITIRDKDEGQCHLSSPEFGSGSDIVHDFSEPNSPCSNDTARSLQFDDFPSATRIFFAGDVDATENTHQNFWIELITTRKRTSTPIRNLENLFSYNPGDIIEPGLMLRRKFRKDGNAQVRDALTSVRITAATSPPVMPPAAR